MSTNYEQDLFVSELVGLSSQGVSEGFVIGVLDTVLPNEATPSSMHVKMKFGGSSVAQDCLFLLSSFPELKLPSNVGKNFCVLNSGGTYLVLGMIQVVAVNEE